MPILSSTTTSPDTGSSNPESSLIGYMTPGQKHAGQAELILQQRKNYIAAVRGQRIDIPAVTTVNRWRLAVFHLHCWRPYLKTAPSH
jgi:hypothetical protein